MGKETSSNRDANSYRFSDPSSFDGYQYPQNFQQFPIQPNPHQYHTPSNIPNPRGFLFPHHMNFQQHFFNSQPYHSQQFPSPYYAQAEEFNQALGFQPPQGSPSPGLSAKGLEVINLNDDPDDDDETNDFALKRQGYTSVESVVLARCWVDISVDPIIGNDQKQDQYWKRISEAYNKNCPKEFPRRKPIMLKSHWQRLQKDSKLFQECYSRCREVWPSGHSDADILRNAHEEFKKLSKGKPFKHINVWDILKLCPKFGPVDGDIHSSKRTKTSNSGAYSSYPGAESIESEPAYPHPEGQKAAKRKAKQKGKISQPTLEKINEDLGKAQKNLSEIAATMQYKTEYAIMMRNTSKMNEEQLEIHNKVCEKIKKKWNLD